MHAQVPRLYFTEKSSCRALGRELGITPLPAFTLKTGRGIRKFALDVNLLQPRGPQTQPFKC